MNNIMNKLLKNPEDFDFFQAVRLLEEYLNLKNLNMSDAHSIFENGNVSGNNKFIRFKHNASLIFPVNEIEKISAVDARWEINSNVMGIIGPSGVLHNHHTALIIKRLQHKDFALRDFLDIFQHRIVSFFYFSWEKNHFYSDKQSKSSRILLSLIGQNTPFLQNRENIPDEVMLFYASYFSRYQRTVLGLESILSDYFNCSIRVKVFQKKTLLLLDNEQSQLSCFPIEKLIKNKKSEKKFNQLSVDAICGQRQRQNQYHFSLIIGPLDIDKFMSFLPDQKNFIFIIALTRRYSGVEYTFDIRLMLSAKAVPYCKFGEFSSAKLGWNSWLKVREFESDADNTVLYIRN